jgi:hypothetical protein
VSEPSAEALAETLGQTLEEAAFIFTEPQERPPPFRGDVIEARIDYRGPHAGELLLTADGSLASTLAANLLGEEEGEASAARAPDAVGELLNMVLGIWVQRLFGDQVRCALGVPKIGRRSAGEASGPPAGATCAAHLVEEQGRRIDLALWLRPGGGAP